MGDRGQGSQVRAVIRATFNAAAPHFEDERLFFWGAVGGRTVELAGLEPGNEVLDVCCGAGASALQAAQRVGPRGRVVGIDLADLLLARARVKARGLGLCNVEFVAGDMAALAVRDSSVDAVLCVLGLYYAPDQHRALIELWRVVKPGGVLAVTVWGRRSLEPAQSLFLDTVADVRPDLDARSTTVASRLGDPALLGAALAQVGATGACVVEEVLAHACTPSDFWAVVLGSGYRVSLDAMDRADVERVRRGTLQRLRDAEVGTVTSDVLYACARKAG
jgi:SAM-dependent methyltransferase